MKVLLVLSSATISLLTPYTAFCDTPEIIFNSYSARDSGYWTAERREKAIPVDTSEISVTELNKFIPSSESGYPPQLTAAGIPERAELSKDPFRTAGKLFFTKYDGTDGYCTAQFIKNDNILSTAGHCVRDAKTKKWHKNFNFQASFSNGSYTSEHDWQCVSTWKSYTLDVSGWTQNWAKDYAFLYMKNPSLNGFLNLRLSDSFLSVVAIGYPGNYENGKYLMKVSGERQRPLSTHVIPLNNNPMRKGNSGGAWIEMKDKSTTDNFIVGIESFSYTNQKTTTYSPVLDSEYAELLNITDEKCRP